MGKGSKGKWKAFTRDLWCVSCNDDSYDNTPDDAVSSGRRRKDAEQGTGIETETFLPSDDKQSDRYSTKPHSSKVHHSRSIFTDEDIKTARERHRSEGHVIETKAEVNRATTSSPHGTNYNFDSRGERNEDVHTEYDQMSLIEKLRSEIKKLVSENERLTNEKGKLSAMNEKLKDDNNITKTKIESLIDKNKTIKATNIQLKNKTQNIQAEKRELDKKVEMLKEKLKNTQCEPDIKISEHANNRKIQEHYEAKIDQMEIEVASKSMKRTQDQDTEVRKTKSRKHTLDTGNAKQEQCVSEISQPEKRPLEFNSVDTIETENKRLKDEILAKEADLKSLGKEMETFKQYNSKLIQDKDCEIAALQVQIDNFRTQLPEEKTNVLNAKIHSLKEVIKNKDNEINDLKKEKKTMKQQVHGPDNKTLREQKHELENEIVSVKEELGSLKQQLKYNEEEVSDFKSLNEQLSERDTALVGQIERKDIEITELKEQLSEKVAGVSKCENEIKALKERMDDRDRTIENNLEVHNTNKDTALDKESELHESLLPEKGVSCTENILDDDLEDVTDTDIQLLQDEKPNQKPTVQVYCRGENDLTARAISTFSKKLQSELDDTGIILKVSNTVHKLAADVPTVCLCVTVSRLGTDVQNAVLDITLDQNVILVILHHKAVHSIPAAASRQVLTDQKYKTLAGMFDLAFEKTELHECDLNRSSMSAIIDWLKQKLQNSLTLPSEVNIS